MNDKIKELENMLEDVVNELDLSEISIKKHGQLGTCPAELVRLVLDQKDKEITMLKAGLINQIVVFLQSDIGFLCDHVSTDLDIKVDYECSQLFDMVESNFLPASFEEIVEKTRDRVIAAIESFLE